MGVCAVIPCLCLWHEVYWEIPLSSSFKYKSWSCKINVTQPLLNWLTEGIVHSFDNFQAQDYRNCFPWFQIASLPTPTACAWTCCLFSSCHGRSLSRLWGHGSLGPRPHSLLSSQRLCFFNSPHLLNNQFPMTSHSFSSTIKYFVIFSVLKGMFSRPNTPSSYHFISLLLFVAKILMKLSIFFVST